MATAAAAAPVPSRGATESKLLWKEAGMERRGGAMPYSQCRAGEPSGKFSRSACSTLEQLRSSAAG